MAQFDYDDIDTAWRKHKRLGPDLDDIFKLVRAIALVSVWALAIAFGLSAIVLMFKGAITLALFMAFIALLFRPWHP